MHPDAPALRSHAVPTAATAVATFLAGWLLVPNLLLLCLVAIGFIHTSSLVSCVGLCLLLPAAAVTLGWRLGRWGTLCVAFPLGFAAGVVQVLGLFG